MRTVTLDILDDKALNLLKDLELLKVIRLHNSKEDNLSVNSIKKYKGLMSKQSFNDIDKQLNDLRKE